MKSKRDNFKDYRNKLVETNTKLIQKSIDSIISMKGELSSNNVSKTSFLVADKNLGEKGITPSTISKNTLYKTLIQKAQLESSSNKKTTSFSTDGDIRIKLFTTNIEKEKLIKENLLLKKVLKKYGGNLTSFDISNYEDIEKAELIRQSAKGLIQRLFELGLIEHSMDNGALVLAQLGDVLLQKQGYNLIMGEK